MADRIEVQPINFDALARALGDAPDLMYRFSRREMGAFGKRFQKQFFKERLSGRPGIKWRGGRKVGGNVKTIVSGGSVGELALTGKLSRFLRAHEEGATIRPTRGSYLYLSRKSGRGGPGGAIFARVKQVTIPARLGFVPMFKERVDSDLKPRLLRAGERALQVAFERRMRRIASAGSAFASGVRALA